MKGDSGELECQPSGIKPARNLTRTDAGKLRDGKCVKSPECGETKIPSGSARLTRLTRIGKLLSWSVLPSKSIQTVRANLLT